MSTATLEDLDFDIIALADEAPELLCEAYTRSTGVVCNRKATHSAFCRKCGRFLCLLCGEHALVLSTSPVPAREEQCGARASWAELLRVVEL